MLFRSTASWRRGLASCQKTERSDSSVPAQPLELKSSSPRERGEKKRLFFFPSFLSLLSSFCSLFVPLLKKRGGKKCFFLGARALLDAHPSLRSSRERRVRGVRAISGSKPVQKEARRMRQQFSLSFLSFSRFRFPRLLLFSLTCGQAVLLGHQAVLFPARRCFSRRRATERV